MPTPMNRISLLVSTFCAHTFVVILAEVQIKLGEISIQRPVFHEAPGGGRGNEQTFNESIFVTDVLVGTPPQMFRVYVDTFSANFWVPDTSCGFDCPSYCKDPVYCKSICPNSCCSAGPRKCAAKKKFDRTKSETYLPKSGTWNVSYAFAAGNASGFFGSDMIRVGDNGFPMTIRDAWFGQAKEIDSTFEDAPYDGVFGLGYSTIAVGGAKPLLTAAIDQNLMFPMFTVRLSDNGGFITLGADDVDHCSPLMDWVPLNSLTYYRFYMETYGWKGKSSYGDFWTTAAGIGDSFIRGPPVVVESLVKEVGATAQSNSDYYFLPCDTALPDFVLKAIDKHKIAGGDLLLPTSDSSSCILAMLPLNSNGILPSWTLGTPLMRHHCGVYDISGFNYGIASSY